MVSGIARWWFSRTWVKGAEVPSSESREGQLNAEFDHPYILINGGSPNGVAIPVIKANLSVGRDQEADIVIEDPTVSRKHAEIVRSDYGFILLDLGSKNGSFVNETKVGHTGQSLKDGDEIRFGPGHSALVFREKYVTEVEDKEPRVTESFIFQRDQPGQLGESDDPGEVLEDAVVSGPVRLRAVAEGNSQDITRWVGRLQSKAHIHMLRAVSVSASEMEIILTVLEPLPLVRMLSDIGGVASIKSGNGGVEGNSGDERRVFTVVLSG